MNPNNDFAEQVERYVLSPDLDVEFGNPGLGGEKTIAKSDLYLAIDAWEKRVVDVFFHLAGISPIGTGIFDLQIRNSAVQSAYENGLLSENFFVLDVEAFYLDEQVVAASPLEAVGAEEGEATHVFASRPDRFIGRLQGQLVFDNDTIYVRETLLTLNADPEHSQYGAVQAIQVEIQEAEGRLRYSLGASESCSKHLSLELVSFEPDPSAPTPVRDIAAEMQDMLDRAEELWRPGGITWDTDIRTPDVDFVLAAQHPLQGNNLMTLYNKCTKRALWTPVFFLTCNLRSDEHSGGLTNDDSIDINTGTALAMVFIGANKCNLVLAHELGHVMKGMHFNTTFLGTDEWRADPQTVLVSPPRARNSANNCRQARPPWPGQGASCDPTFVEEKWTIPSHPGCSN